MITVEVNILADDDREFVMTILGALAQRELIDFERIDSFPVEGPVLSESELTARAAKAEQGQRNSYAEAMTRLGL